MSTGSDLVGLETITPHPPSSLHTHHTRTRQHARARARTHTHDSHELNYQGAWDAARRLWLQNNTEDCLHCLHKIANSPAEYGEEVAERHKLRLQSLGEWQDEEWGQGGAGGAGSTRVGKPETQAEWTARV